jgi:Right handed beta helix region
MVQFLNQHGHYLTDPEVIGNRLTNFGRPASSGPCPADGRQHGPGIYIIGVGAVIENNIVSNANNMGIQVYEQSCQAVISNNTVFNNRNAGIIVGGGGPNCSANGNNTINNNIVVNNKGNGLAEVGGAAPAAIVVQVIRHCGRII